MGYVRDITARKRAEEELTKSFERIQKRLEETVNALASMTEKRDPYTAGHQQRVTQLAKAIAEEMELPESQIEGTIVAATLHDIGKIYEPAEILSKPDILTEIEMLMMKVHPDVAYEILKNIDFPWPVARIVRQHHERYDGSGYPDGLKGGEILLEARIIAVADVVEAMASHRPYRSALGIEQALAEIIQNRGILYDPDVVDACLRVFRERGFVFKMHPYTELRLRCSN
jgi:putative nucleotidyltransferase with HDIG domain